MNKILTIIKKELRRFFTDKRILASLFMPGILIFIIYSIMGTIFTSAFLPSDDYQYNIYVSNCPTEYENYFQNDKYKINLNKDFNINEETIKNKIVDDEIDLYIVFDEDFVNKKENGQTPNVSLFYNSESTHSQTIYSYYFELFIGDSTNVTYEYYVNNNPDVIYDLADTNSIITSLLSSIVPFILLIFLFSGCLAISTESIAGEKERGTIATLLVTPTKRSHIAIGKIIALSITSLASAITSTIGLLLSFPKLLNMDELSGIDLNFNIYGIKEFLSIFIIIALTVILFTTILSLISTMAKTIKEASQWSSMIMVLVMFIGLLSFINIGGQDVNTFFYLIPIYNIVLCIKGIFGMTISFLNLFITILSTLAYIGLGIFALTKMFNSEKIMSSN